MNWLGDVATWLETKERFPIGATVTAAVYSVATFGVFVDLGNGGVGLLLVPEMAGDSPKKMDDYPQVGQTVTATVIAYGDANRQVCLTQRTYDLTG